MNTNIKDCPLENTYCEADIEQQREPMAIANIEDAPRILAEATLGAAVSKKLDGQIGDTFELAKDMSLINVSKLGKDMEDNDFDSLDTTCSEDEPIEKYDYYKKGLTPYEVIRAYEHIKDPAHQHALKKLMRLGQNHKDVIQDLTETIDSLVNYKDYLERKVLNNE